MIIGHLSLLADPGRRDPRVAAALQAAQRIQEIVQQMGRITRVKMLPRTSRGLPPTLDIRASADLD